MISFKKKGSLTCDKEKALTRESIGVSGCVRNKIAVWRSPYRLILEKGDGERNVVVILDLMRLLKAAGISFGVITLFLFAGKNMTYKGK